MQSVYLQRIMKKNAPKLYEKQSQNKPNFPKAKMNASLYVTDDYENEPPSGPKKTNPIKACPERSEFTLSLIEGNGPIFSPL